MSTENDLSEGHRTGEADSQSDRGAERLPSVLPVWLLEFSDYASDKVASGIQRRLPSSGDLRSGRDYEKLTSHV